MGQSGTASKKVNASSDPFINGLLEGSAWDSDVFGRTVLTWSEPTSSTPFSSYSTTTLTGVSAVTTHEDTNIRHALGEWSSVANLVFNPITETNTTHADLRFAQASTTPDAPGTTNNNQFFGASGSWPDQKTLNDLAGDTFFHSGGSSRAETQLQNTQPGSWGDHVARHEIGHDLGLKHAFDKNSQLGATGATGVAIPASHDSWEYTIMTYHAYAGAPDYVVANRSDIGSYAQSLMMDDIQAIQYLYGANFNTNSGNTHYTFDPNTGQMFVDGVGQGAPLTNKIFRTIWDGGGSDTYDLSNYTTDMTIDLRPGSWSTFSTTQLADLGQRVDTTQTIAGDVHHAAVGNVANAELYQGDIRSLIENAIGGNGNDTITGNSANNTLSGGGGNDTLDGSDGNDRLDGGIAADTMMGGHGNDTYVVDNVGDVVSEWGTIAVIDFPGGGHVNVPGDMGGSDTIETTLNSYALNNLQSTSTVDLIENLTFAGTGAFAGTGNALDNVITGGDGADHLFGMEGSDKLYGGKGSDMLDGAAGDDRLDGGAGADNMVGGSGNDSYIVDDVNDVVDDAITQQDGLRVDAGGIDEVRTTLTTYTIVIGTTNASFNGYVENLLFIGTGNFTGTGNAKDNLIEGGLGNDILLGGEGSDILYVFDGNDRLDGGIGADTMIGGRGNDTYVIDNVGDVVTENSNEGNDLVHTTIDYALSANVESLILDGTTINGSGNADNNAIIGNSSNNIIDGKAGADYMVGGAGNDIYFVDNPGDAVVENLNEGNDIIHVSIDYTIGANIESLILDGLTINGAGNATGNAIVGNDANNIIDGRGGGDLMQGGKGNDVYFVDNAADSVVENLNEGNDIVHASIDYTIGANIESLILDNTSVNGSGNSDGNAIIGNDSNNIIDGKGGADLMQGGKGNDIYFVDDAGDTVVENPNEGNDIVHASIDYTIGANIESLILDGSVVNGAGNSSGNALVGNAGDNNLDGRGGADFLTGNGGNDIFIFRAGEAGGDVIADFAGNGAALGDSLHFVGFGTAGQGATFTKIGATNQWQIHSGLDGHDEVITLQNSASVHVSDFFFV